MPPARRRLDPDATALKQSDVAYQRFKDAMLDGRIELGARITQSDLAELLGVQISGLRVAINKLETEGLVTVLARCGIKIVKPDLFMIRNSYQLRGMIEQEGLRAFIRRASDQAVRELRERHEQLLADLAGDADEAETIKAVLELDAETHARFVRALENPLIDTVFNNNEERLALIRRDRLPYRSRIILMETFQEHLEFVRAVERREPEAAVRALNAHLSASMKRAMGM